MPNHTIPSLTMNKNGTRLKVGVTPGNSGALHLEFSETGPGGKKNEMVIRLTLAQTLKLVAAACGLRTGHTEALMEEYQNQNGAPQLPHWLIAEDNPPKWLGFTPLNRPHHVCLTAREPTSGNRHESRFLSIPLGYTDLFALETWAYESVLAILRTRSRLSPTVPQRDATGQSTGQPARRAFIGSQRTLTGKVATLPEEIRQAPGTSKDNGHVPKASG